MSMKGSFRDGFTQLDAVWVVLDSAGNSRSKSDRRRTIKGRFILLSGSAKATPEKGASINDVDKYTPWMTCRVVAYRVNPDIGVASFGTNMYLKMARQLVLG